MTESGVSHSGRAGRFRCTLGGAVARGRRRLGLLLGLMAALMLVLATTLWIQGRILPGLLAAGAALLIRTGWTLSGELLPRWLELRPGELILELPRRQLSVELAGAAGRRLSAQEITHLERLASAGGIVAGSGGFDSHLLGEFDLYASDLVNSVLLESGDTRLVTTPDEPEAFLAALEVAADL